MADFDPTKPVQTRDGSPARIVCTDRKGGPPLIALVRGQERAERICSFYPNGQVCTTHCSGPDLVNVPERAYDLAGAPRTFGKLAELGMAYGSSAVLVEALNALVDRVAALETQLRRVREVLGND